VKRSTSGSGCCSPAGRLSRIKLDGATGEAPDRVAVELNALGELLEGAAGGVSRSDAGAGGLLERGKRREAQHGVARGREGIFE